MHHVPSRYPGRHTGEMELVRIADEFTDLFHGLVRELQELGGLDHAVADQELLRRGADRLLKETAEVGPAETGVLRDLLDGNIIHKVVFNVLQGFVNIEVLHFISRRVGRALDGPDQIVEEEIEVSDQVERGGIAVIHDVAHLLQHLIPELRTPRVVDR